MKSGIQNRALSYTIEDKSQWGPSIGPFIHYANSVNAGMAMDPYFKPVNASVRTMPFFHALP